MTRFVWDRRKAAANLRKHGVSFEEAGTVFEDEWALTSPDERHADEEDREVTTGRSAAGRLVTVGHVWRGGRLRLFTARLATPEERRDYDGDAGD